VSSLPTLEHEMRAMEDLDGETIARMLAPYPNEAAMQGSQATAQAPPQALQPDAEHAAGGALPQEESGALLPAPLPAKSRKTGMRAHMCYLGVSSLAIDMVRSSAAQVRR
jgi:hypothetical protein